MALLYSKHSGLSALSCDVGWLDQYIIYYLTLIGDIIKLKDPAPTFIREKALKVANHLGN